MATEISIANLALSHLGDDATVASLNPPEGSAQAEHCALFLPMARDVMLELHDWKFARRRASLALRTETNDAWQYVYAEPADCVRILKVLPYGYAYDDNETEMFETGIADDGTPLIYTNTENSTLIYTSQVVNPARWPPLFVSALTWLLASYVAGPLIKGDEGKKAGLDAYQVFLGEASRAMGSNANQVRQRIERMPPHISARGASSDAWRDLPPIRGL